MSEDRNLPARVDHESSGIGIWGAVVGGAAALMAVGYSLYLVAQWLVLVGYFLIIALTLFILGLLLFGGIWLTRYAFRATAYDISTHGTVLQDLFGGKTVYAPLGGSQKMLPRKATTTVTPAIPSI